MARKDPAAGEGQIDHPLVNSYVVGGTGEVSAPVRRPRTAAKKAAAKKAAAKASATSTVKATGEK